MNYWLVIKAICVKQDTLVLMRNQLYQFCSEHISTLAIIIICMLGCFLYCNCLRYSYWYLYLPQMPPVLETSLIYFIFNKTVGHHLCQFFHRAILVWDLLARRWMMIRYISLWLCMPGPALHGPQRYIGFINTEANNVQYMLAFDVGLRFSFFFQSFFFFIMVQWLITRQFLILSHVKLKEAKNWFDVKVQWKWGIWMFLHSHLKVFNIFYKCSVIF